MHLSILTFAAALQLATSSPTPARPSVTIKNGTVVGQIKYNVDSFLGIPYAKPPVKSLRLRPPQSIEHHYGTLDLPTLTPACIQMNMSSVDTTGLPAEAVAVMDGLSSNYTNPMSEDCLYVNVQRPAGVKKGDKLPVLFWIYGGGFEIGTTNDYDSTGIVLTSVGMKEPVIVVEVSYRLNAFGFLQGKELAHDGSTNLGLRDQRKGMEWVAENIAEFGGDPNRVTIWGESAGAVSVFDHLTINKGDNTYRGKPLFHGAIMNSGTALRTLPVTSEKAQDVFNKVVEAADCKCGRQDHEVLECLRNAPLDKFINAMQSLPNFAQVSANNLAYLPRPDGSSDFFSIDAADAVAKGQFARVPVIMGNMQDESTPFAVAQRNIINNTDTLVDYFSTYFPDSSRHSVAEFVATYPDNPSAGLPADTGDQWELYPQYKRNAAIQSDLIFFMGRRQALGLMASKVPAWSYLATFDYGFPQFGSYHTDDLATQFGLQEHQIAAQNMDAAYINFVNTYSPNFPGANPGTPHYWPKWDNKNIQMMNFSATDMTITKDNFREKSFEWFIKHHDELKM